MKFLLTLFALSLPVSALEDGFQPLFNGKDLTGWTRVNGDGEFKVDDGCIAGVGDNVKSNTFLRTDKTYKNFDFRFEMKFDNLEGNSGMMFRGLQKPGKDGRVNGYQCEHDNRKGRAWTAGLYDEARRGWLVPRKNDSDPKPEDKVAQDAFSEQGQKLTKLEEWNDVRILCEGKHIQIWLNGTKRVDYTDEAPEFTPEGFFALQVHAGKSCHVRWKNIRIKEL